MKSNAARFMGLKNRSAGKYFEISLQTAFNLAKMKGIAMIDKTPEPFRVITRQDGGKFIGCYERKAQPDYKGIVKGGISVLIEAKYTSTDRIRQEVVAKHQAAYMAEYANFGAHCYVVVGFGSGNAYLIPFEIWQEMDKYFGRKYATEKDLDQFKVKTAPNGCYLFF